MTVAQIDAALAEWKQRLSNAAQNVMDLTAHPAYHRLAGTNGVPKAQLEGETAAKVGPALAAVSTLVQYYDVLQRTIDQASDLRKKMPVIFGADDTLREIERLLTTKSITLPAVQVPLVSRDLFSKGEDTEKITPDALIALMVQSFNAARDVVLGVDAAWVKLGTALDESEKQIKDLRTQAAAIGTVLPELHQAENTLDDVRERMERDPLGAASDFDSCVTPPLERARLAVELAVRQRTEVAQALAAARKKLSNVAEAHRVAKSAWVEYQEKIKDGQAQPAADADSFITGLTDWLNRLDTKFREGLIAPVSVGVRNWNKSADNFVSTCTQATTAHRNALDARTELRGRLDALKAKARVYGVAEDPELSPLAQEAANLLYSRPTPLDRAMSLVRDYESKLNRRTSAANGS